VLHPIAHLAQAAFHRLVAQIGNAGIPGPGRRSLRRLPAQAIGERQTQQRFRAAYLAYTLQRLERSRCRFRVDHPIDLADDRFLGAILE